jgi:hypothetical protein
MALSEELKHKVVFALGYIGSVLDSETMNYNSIVNDRLNKTSRFTEEKIQSLIDDLEAAELVLKKGPSKANLKRIGDIELDNTAGIPLVKGEIRRIKNEISQILGIPNFSRSSSMTGVVV